MKQPRTGVTAERYVEATLAVIAEKGGSQDVGLREISRRIGCAHTNVYNYFAGLDDLLWGAFRQVLDDYGTFLFSGLDDTLSPDEWLHQLVRKLVAYPQENPGLYRFIGTDPLSEIPTDILDTVVAMKQRLFEAFRRGAPNVDPAVVDEASNIVYAYIDGETFNLINERVVPGEDVGGRIVGNAIRLFGLLTKD